ncbi:acyl-CoA dehydrogenase [Gordonia sp. SID5947]|uniref:acyl-CoA dehydrogenase family protein n=1 Tax=Gordonia sp. SID5947 TaxID=2690315 RepID=UPI00136C13DA|nr:acyl-CoA dehydrogenase family protein [Gordonia sp. SID5947]MYR07969.1 acyl-CoA dehydrogenase [Gordonia sp. SID5947]
MKLTLTPEEQQFRDELRTFFTTEMPIQLRDKVRAGVELSRDEMVAAHRILNDGGLASPNWSVEFGGKDWTPLQFHIWLDELHRASSPMPNTFNTTLVGPLLIEFGSPEQQEKFIPPTANLDIWWAQGFSEPEAGSDLAAVKMRAVRDGSDYVLNGQKTWTSEAHLADWIFCLVRTDPNAPKRQQGISFILVDMKTPGITVRPIELIDGYHEVNEVFFDNVRVPAENLVGEENKGWDYAKFLLGNERGAARSVRPLRMDIEKAKRAAASTLLGGRPLLEDPHFAARIADLECRIDALDITLLRVVGESSNGKPSSASSVLKLLDSELQQEVTELLLDVSGRDADPIYADGGLRTEVWTQHAARRYFNMRKKSIYGGSSEVQRTIVASSILGL